jgi:hypothetical protein
VLGDTGFGAIMLCGDNGDSSKDKTPEELRKEYNKRLESYITASVGQERITEALEDL